MLRALSVILVAVFAAADRQGQTGATADGKATAVNTAACRNIRGSDCYADAFRILRDRVGVESNVYGFLQQLLELDSDAARLRHLRRWWMARRDGFLQTNDGQLLDAMLELYFWPYAAANEVDCAVLGERLDNLVGVSCSDGDTVDVVYDVVVQSFCPGVPTMSCAFAGGRRQPFR